jgi:hypothetical protein
VERGFFATDFAKPRAVVKLRDRFFKAASTVTNRKNPRQGITKPDTGVLNSRAGLFLKWVGPDMMAAIIRFPNG